MYTVQCTQFYGQSLHCYSSFLMFLRITLHSTRSVFDPSQFAGLPLNVMALMPVLVHHFDQPTEFCIKVVSEIQQVHVTILY